MSRLRIYNATIVTPEGRNALKGSEMATGVKHIPDAEIVIEDGVITAIGPSRGDLGDSTDIDAESRVVVPGFVDSHTHPVFGGWRPEEFGWRLRGDSYMSIMNRGGGIVSTMRATREATGDELRAKTLALLDRAATMGVTTMEAKSGYGLDLNSELIQLQVIASLSADPSTPVTLTSTFLGAHAVPPNGPATPTATSTTSSATCCPVSRRKDWPSRSTSSVRRAFSVSSSRAGCSRPPARWGSR